MVPARPHSTSNHKASRSCIQDVLRRPEHQHVRDGNGHSACGRLHAGSPRAKSGLYLTVRCCMASRSLANQNIKEQAERLYWQGWRAHPFMQGALLPPGGARSSARVAADVWQALLAFERARSAGAST
jgi:hypothetical protein